MLIEKISKHSGIAEAKLRTIARTASHRYKTYRIPKRTSGTREVNHPSRELKSLQRIVAKEIFASFPVHESATAYRKGAGIRGNAERHLPNQYLIRIDFKDFFPSWTEDHVRTLLRRKRPELSHEDVMFIGKILCKKGKIIIGSPTSPVVTNILMFDFDVSISTFCKRADIVYTRYADDLIFSSNTSGALDHIAEHVTKTVKTLGLPLFINHEKTWSTSKKHRRAVTGVILTSDSKLSVGRERKRNIRSKIFQLLQQEKPSEKDANRVAGELAYICSIEPDFKHRMEIKFGAQKLIALLALAEKDKPVISQSGRVTV